MKILFLSSWFPYPPINGAKIRIYNLLHELGKIHDISLISFAKTITIDEARNNIPILKQFCHTVEVVKAKSYSPGDISTFSGYFSPLPSSVVNTYSVEMARIIEEKINNENFDIVMGSEVNAPSITSHFLSRINNIPKVIDALEIGLIKDSYYNQKSLIHKIRNGLTWIKLKRFTRKVLLRADACTVPSLKEKQNIEEIVRKQILIEIIPHSLDLDYYSVPCEPPSSQLITFTGSFNYYANLDAAQYLINNIYPIIISRFPHIRLQIIGDTQGYELNKFTEINPITFTGLLKDPRQSIGHSWLSVVPLRIGAGTRLKIIESMALGTPVVSTSKGAEGLDIQDGKNIMIADDPGEFAQKVIQILLNPNLRNELSKEGLKLVSEKYNSKVMGKKISNLLEQVVSSRHSVK